jgi:site-specific DNA recombinase
MTTYIQEIAPKRCAVYCRVSSEERLDQSFNSIDAQREAGAAFVESQRAEGWELIPDTYEDAGFSGGNMNRPALKRLLTDIKAGKVNMIVVYKIDRLSRSLANFVHMVELFDKHQVSFSSVTQQINSSTSMGRLMLNVLLSFAQFEREVTGERIRDKIKAAKRKGMWMGGPVPLGYRVVDRKLLVDPREAKTVKWIFDSYLETKSTTHMVRTLAHEGVKSKRGAALCKNTLYKILKNRMYIGMLSHKGEHFQGEHSPIIEQSVWDEVQGIMAVNLVNNGHKSNDLQDTFLLRGMVYTDQGELFLPISKRKPNGIRYGYYVVNKNQNMGAGMGSMGNLCAKKLEAIVCDQVLQVMRTDQSVHVSWSLIHAACPNLIGPEQVVGAFQKTASVWNQLFPEVRNDIVRRLLKQVTVHEKGLRLDWRYESWGAFANALSTRSGVRHIIKAEQV